MSIVYCRAHSIKQKVNRLEFKKGTGISKTIRIFFTHHTPGTEDCLNCFKLKSHVLKYHAELYVCSIHHHVETSWKKDKICSAFGVPLTIVK